MANREIQELERVVNLRIYTKDGFTKNEKEEWRVIIFNNILDGLRMTIDAMEDFDIPFEFENTTVRILLLCPES